MALRGAEAVQATYQGPALGLVEPGRAAYVGLVLLRGNRGGVDGEDAVTDRRIKKQEARREDL